jgi:hypothetical protein
MHVIGWRYKRKTSLHSIPQDMGAQNWISAFPSLAARFFRSNLGFKVPEVMKSHTREERDEEGDARTCV